MQIASQCRTGTWRYQPQDSSSRTLVCIHLALQIVYVHNFFLCRAQFPLQILLANGADRLGACWSQVHPVRTVLRCIRLREWCGDSGLWRPQKLGVRITPPASPQAEQNQDQCDYQARSQNCAYDYTRKPRVQIVTNA